MLSIFLSIVLIAASADLPCLIATIKVSSNFGALGERFYIKRIWLQILKTLKEEIMQSGSFSDVKRGA